MVLFISKENRWYGRKWLCNQIKTERKENMKEKKFTLATREGCVRILLICLCLILIFSFIAQLYSSDGGRIKVETISIDARGANLSADLYYPAGVTDRDSIPAVIFAHGAGVTKGNYRGIAEEIARRGFVVLNINGYGTGYSELPVYDESNMGIEHYDTFASSSGTLDALNFIRTLKFVDQTRIGLAGHSQGSRRMEICAALDCGYYTLNDLLLNVLHDEFGLELTEEEITQNADELAEAKLNPEDLKLYYYIKGEKEEWFNTRAKALCLIGSDARNSAKLQTVKVAGHEVQRNIRINRVVVNGLYDKIGFSDTEDYKAAHFTTETLKDDIWYVLNDETATSEAVGSFYDSVLSNTKLQEAINNRSTRIITINVEDHSKNFFSEQTAADIVRYFEQTLMYNNGELGDPNAKPIDPDNIKYIRREIFNALAMFTMLTMLMPLMKLILGTKFFKPCLGTSEAPAIEYGKKRFWIVNILAVVFGFISMYIINNKIIPWNMPSNQTWPIFFSWWLTLIFLACVAGFTLVEIIVLCIIDKKKFGRNGLASTNIKIRFVNVLKSLLASLLVIIAAYVSLSVIRYLFNQDYRLWMYALPELKVEYWLMVIQYALFFLPATLIIGVGINYAPNRKLPEWLDDLLVVVFNSLGVWLLCLIENLLIAKNGAKWTFTYGFLISVPVVSYMTRRMFKATKNVWIGASVSAMLLAWLLIGTLGYNVYHAQSWLSIFCNM